MRFAALLHRVVMPVVAVSLTLFVAEVAARLYYATAGAQVRISAIPGLIYELPEGSHGANRLGFRGKLADDRVASGTCRLMVAGDSVAFGSGHELYAVTMVPRAEAHLNAGDANVRYELTSIAVPGYNIEQIATNYAARARDYPHHVLLYAFFRNDFDRPDGMYGWGAGDELMAMMPHDGMLWAPPLIGVKIDERLSLSSRFYLWLRTRAFVKFGLRAIEATHYERRREVRRELSERQFGRMVRSAREGGHEVVVALVPSLVSTLTREQCNAQPIDGVMGFCNHDTEPYDWAREFAARDGVPVVDLAGAYTRNVGRDFRLQGRPFDWSHPNAEGADLLGRELAVRWREMGLERLCRGAGEKR